MIKDCFFINEGYNLLYELKKNIFRIAQKHSLLFNANKIKAIILYPHSYFVFSHNRLKPLL